MRCRNELYPSIPLDSMDSLPRRSVDHGHTKIFTPSVQPLTIRRPFNVENGIFKLEISNIGDRNRSPMLLLVAINAQYPLAVSDCHRLASWAEFDCVHPCIVSIDGVKFHTLDLALLIDDLRRNVVVLFNNLQNRCLAVATADHQGSCVLQPIQ